MQKSSLRTLRQLLRQHLRIIGQFNLKRTTAGIPKRSARFRRRSCSSKSTSSTAAASRFLLPAATPACSSLVMPKRSARDLSFSGSYSCKASPQRYVERHVDLTSPALAALGGRTGVDFVLGLEDSTRAMPKRAARAFRFSNSSSVEVAVATTGVLSASHPPRADFCGSTFD
jgi:hypothetical protein